MISEKWTMFVRWPYYIWVIEYITFLAVFTLEISLRPDGWLSPWYPNITVGVLEVFLVFHYILSFFFEVFDLIYLQSFFITANGGLVTSLAWVSGLSFFAAVVLRIAHIPVGEEVCLAFAVVAAWFYFLHLVRAVNPKVGIFISIIFEVIGYDLLLFIGLYVVIVMAFSCGMTLLGLIPVPLLHPLFCLL